MDAKYQYTKGKDEKWYFHLKAANGEIVHGSQGYSDKPGCLEGIETVKRLAPAAAVQEKSEDN